MPKLTDVNSREAIFHLIRLDGIHPIYKNDILHARALTRDELSQKVIEASERGVMPPYRPGTVGRVLGSLVNDGLVSRQRGPEGFMWYWTTEPHWEMEDTRIELLRASQSAKYVSWKRGQRKTGYNSIRSRQPISIHRGLKLTKRREENDPIRTRWAKDDGTKDQRKNWIP